MKNIITTEKHYHYRKTLSLLLTLFMLVGICLFSARVNAADAPGVTEKEAVEKIDTLIDLLEGEYFTVNQKACEKNRESSHGCDNCSNSEIIQTDWFTELFGSGLDVYQFPTHADYNWGVWNKGAHGGGKSCYGFATFAQWYIFSSDHTDDIEHEVVVQNVDCTYRSMKENAKPGDVIRTEGHSMIFISCDKNGYRVLDCNGWSSDLNCMVRSKVRSYGGKMAISRATNYEIETAKTNTKTQYRYYHYTDGNGHYNVCAYSGQSKYGTKFYREDTGWLDAPLILTSKSATSYTHVQQGIICTKAGCTDDSWEGGKYIDADGVAWYREETREMQTTTSTHAHTYDKGTVTTKATCAKAGVKTYTCTACGASKTETIPKGEHLFDDGVVKKEVSCDDVGEIVYTCEVCGRRELEYVSKTAHIWDDGTVTKAATCKESGVLTYTCVLCGDQTRKEAIATLEHSYTVSTEEIAATCTQKGKTAVEVCTLCGAERGGKAIAKLRHEYALEWTVDKAPTCTATGIKSHHCMLCDAKGTSRAIEKTNHSYGEWEIVTPAQPGKKGSRARTCENCGTVDTETIAALPKLTNDKRIIMTVDNTDVTVFGKTSKMDVAPIIANDRTMLPARFVAENLGASVAWDGESRTVTITTESLIIELRIGSSVAYVNGEAVALDSPAFIRNNRTYTPVRFIAETLGAKVGWNAENRQVTLTKE